MTNRCFRAALGVAALTCTASTLVTMEPASASWPLDFLGPAEISRSSPGAVQLLPPREHRYYTHELVGAATVYLRLNGVGLTPPAGLAPSRSSVHVKCAGGIDQRIDVPWLELVPDGAVLPGLSVRGSAARLFKLPTYPTRPSEQSNGPYHVTLALTGTKARVAATVAEYASATGGLVARYTRTLIPGAASSTPVLNPRTRYIAVGTTGKVAPSSRIGAILRLSYRLESPRTGAPFATCRVSSPNSFSLSLQSAEYGLKVAPAAIDAVPYRRADALRGLLLLVFLAALGLAAFVGARLSRAQSSTRGQLPRSSPVSQQRRGNAQEGRPPV